MAYFPKKLTVKLEKRHQENALRILPSIGQLVDFSSNDYLGFAREKAISDTTFRYLSPSTAPCNGATGSRLLSGNYGLYEELERKLVQVHASEAALVFNSGYDANLGFFASVPQRGDIILFDELIHASIRDGIQMSNAKSFKFSHNNIDSLTKTFHRACSKTVADAVVYVVTESVFSMDGDTPDLQALVDFSNENGCHLVVDEAHAVGVFGTNGAGLIQELGLNEKVFARIITFGKAFGCHGAAVLGSSKLKAYLVNFARSLIYTTGLPPHSIATILAAYDYICSDEGEEKRENLHKTIEKFKQELSNLGLKALFISSNSAIHCCIVPGNQQVKQVALKLQEKGFGVKPILSPTVRKGAERLRFCLHAYNTDAEISEVASHLSYLISGS